MQNTFEVHDVFDIAGRGTVITGVLRSGAVRIGMQTTVNGVNGTVAGLESKNTELTLAGAEGAVLIRGIEKKHFSRGMLVQFF